VIFAKHCHTNNMLYVSAESSVRNGDYDVRNVNYVALLDHVKSVCSAGV